MCDPKSSNSTTLAQLEQISREFSVCKYILFVTTVIHFNFIHPNQMVTRYHTTRYSDAYVLQMHIE